MNKNRPVNLDITTFRLPITPYSSILHRISGVFLFLLIPLLLVMLDRSLESPEEFSRLQDSMDGFVMKFVVWTVVSALLYHLVAGVRHMIMDMGYGETLEGGQLGAKLTIGISAVLIFLAGIWIW